jgi:hypothetical protein
MIFRTRRAIINVVLALAGIFSLTLLLTSISISSPSYSSSPSTSIANINTYPTRDALAGYEKYKAYGYGKGRFSWGPCFRFTRKRMLLTIVTAAKATGPRNMLRATYKTLLKARGIDVIFVIGRAEDDATAASIGLEHSYFKDVLVLDIKENMNEGKTYFTFKKIHELMESRDLCNYEYIAKNDDDAIVHLPRIDPFLRSIEAKHNTKDNLFIGRLCCTSPPAFTGMLYILSRNLVRFIATDLEPANHHIGHEDQVTSGWFWNSYMRHWVIYETTSQFFDYEKIRWYYYPGQFSNDTIAVHNVKNSTQFSKVTRRLLDPNDIDPEDAEREARMFKEMEESAKRNSEKEASFDIWREHHRFQRLKVQHLEWEEKEIHLKDWEYGKMREAQKEKLQAEQDVLIEDLKEEERKMEEEERKLGKKKKKKVKGGDEKMQVNPDPAPDMPGGDADAAVELEMEGKDTKKGNVMKPKPQLPVQNPADDEEMRRKMDQKMDGKKVRAVDDDGAEQEEA